jgi:3-hydroxyisobutyrate dehydrogenase
LAAAVGIDMKDAFGLFEQFNPGQTLPQRAKRISAGQYSPPSFEMSMARKDLRLTVEAGRARWADAGDGAGVGGAAG